MEFVTPTLVDDLREHLAADRVRAEPLELSLYGHDASIVTGGAAAVVCFPISTEEVQACVRVARATVVRSPPAAPAPGSPVARFRSVSPS